MTDTTQRGARTRRGFMRQLAGTTLVLGFAPRSGRWVTAAETAPDTPFDKVPPLTGTLHLDEVSLDAAAQDFGRLVRRRPIAVLKPGSVRDISRMLRFAARHGLRVAVRGHGHAIYGQTQVEGGIVIDMSTLAGVLVRHGRACVDAGSSWLSVLEATLLRGLTPPVLPDYLGLSVGGTLSIGGVSPTTHRDGAQVDNVLSLEVVTGQGDVVSCSMGRHRDLFQAALAGQGQCAIITSAEIRLVPSPGSVRGFSLLYADIGTAIEDAVGLIGEQRFDGVVIFVVAAAGGQRLHVLLGTKVLLLPRRARQCRPPRGPASCPGQRADPGRELLPVLEPCGGTVSRGRPCRDHPDGARPEGVGLRRARARAAHTRRSGGVWHRADRRVAALPFYASAVPGARRRRVCRVRRDSRQRRSGHARAHGRRQPGPLRRRPRDRRDALSLQRPGAVTRRLAQALRIRLAGARARENGRTTRGTSWPRVRICSASTRRLHLRADGTIAART